jgi:hypothetical protein
MRPSGYAALVMVGFTVHSIMKRLAGEASMDYIYIPIMVLPLMILIVVLSHIGNEQ